MNTDSTRESFDSMKAKLIQNIRDYMYDNFVSVKDVAKSLDKGNSYISKCLSKNSNATIGQLFKIAKAAGMEVGVRTFTLPEKPVDKE